MSPPVLRLLNPYDGSLLAERPYTSPAEVELRLERARATQRRWRRMPYEQRHDRVVRGMDFLREHSAEIAADVTRQVGKPLSQARGEVAGMLSRAQHLLDIGERSLAPEVLPGQDGFVLRIEHVPHGVVLELAAWNYPLLIPINVIVPALLAGNVVLLKHSANAVLCGEWFERAFDDPDLPGLLSHLILDHESLAGWIRDPRIDHVVFTGSVEGGRAIQDAARGRFIDVGLELGGKDPAYVAADADFDFAAENLVDGACYNAGQSCCGVERVYVHADLYDDFLARVQPILENYRLGDPMKDGTTMGPMARPRQPAELEAQVQDALAKGARRLVGGGVVDPRFFAPTLLADCTQDMLVMQEESFGPILPVMRVEDDDEALRAMNDSAFGLTASVWTRDDARAEHFVAELEAGTVFQNRCDFLDPALPWVGVKNSGRGVSLSSYGFLSLTRRKSVHRRLPN